jgi:hypothetical protein
MRMSSEVHVSTVVGDDADEVLYRLEADIVLEDLSLINKLRAAIYAELAAHGQAPKQIITMDPFGR